jgi:ABC-type transporter Mla subunit MlaD
MQMVSEKLSKLKKDSPEVGAVLADVFGSAGEDAAFRFITTIQSVPKSMAAIEDKTPAVEKALRKLNDEWIIITGNLVSGSGDFSAAIANLIDFAAELLKNSQPITDTFKTIYDEVKSVVSVFVELGRSIGLFNEKTS